jgi:hypothetical protein
MSYLAKTLWKRFGANFTVIFGPWAVGLVLYALNQLQAHQRIDWNLAYTGILAALALWVKQYQSTLDVKAPSKLGM